jgi:hypothetical protein
MPMAEKKIRAKLTVVGLCQTCRYWFVDGDGDRLGNHVGECLHVGSDVYGDPDLAPPDRTRSDVCHAAAFMSISAWAWAGVL